MSAGLLAAMPWRRPSSGGGPPPGSPILDLWPQVLGSLYQDTGTSTPVTTAGQTVQHVVDQSGNGRDAIQTATINAPQYATGLGPGSNLAGLDFLSTGAHWLKVASFTSPATTYFFVYAVTSSTGTLFTRVRTSGGAAADYVYKTGEIQGDRGTTRLLTNNGFFPDTSYHLGCLRIDPSGANRIEAYLDGTMFTSSALSIGSTDLVANLLLGAFSELGGFPARLLLLRFLTYHTALNSTDRRAVEVYLQALYGTPALP